MSCIGIGRQFPKLKPEYLKRDEEHEAYPYEINGAIVLGPETIASIDGSVLIWRGVVYRREDEIRPPDPYNEH